MLNLFSSWPIFAALRKNTDINMFINLYISPFFLVRDFYRSLCTCTFHTISITRISPLVSNRIYPAAAGKNKIRVTNRTTEWPHKIPANMVGQVIYDIYRRRSDNYSKSCYMWRVVYMVRTKHFAKICGRAVADTFRPGESCAWNPKSCGLRKKCVHQETRYAVKDSRRWDVSFGKNMMG